MFEEINARDNINMSDEELYSFFNRYSLDELELFKIKFDLIKDSKEDRQMLDKVYLEKKEEKSTNPEDDRIITEKIMDKNSTLTNKELNYLYGFTTSIPSYYIDGLENLNISIYQEIEKRHFKKLSDPVKSMKKEDLIEYFSKYELNELEAFQLLFTHAKDYDLTEALSIIRKAYDEKIKEISEEDYYLYRSARRHFGNRVIVLKNKNEGLGKKELKFLRALAQDTRRNLPATECCTCKEQINDLNSLLESINEELKSRKKVYKLKPIK